MDKPPIIDTRTISGNQSLEATLTAIAAAQRDADVEWYNSHWTQKQLDAAKHGTETSRVMQDIAVEEACRRVARDIIQAYEEVIGQFSDSEDWDMIDERWQDRLSAISPTIRVKYLEG